MEKKRVCSVCGLCVREKDGGACTGWGEQKGFKFNKGWKEKQKSTLFVWISLLLFPFLIVASIPGFPEINL